MGVLECGDCEHCRNREQCLDMCEDRMTEEEWKEWSKSI
jgi:hypothetical protein